MVLAEDVLAKDDLPPFRASVMVFNHESYLLKDGYAIKSEAAIVGAMLEVVKAQKGYAGAKSKEM